MVERFNNPWDDQNHMQADKTGPYVCYSDYQALERQLAEARAEAETMRQKAISNAKERNAAEAERDRLVADNARKDAALRGAMSDQHDLLHTCREYAKAAPDENIRAVRYIRADRIEERLNATRAALAEKE